MDIVDLKLVDGNQLMFLDRVNGIFTLNIDDINALKFVPSMTVYLPGAQTFAYKNNCVLVSIFDNKKGAIFVELNYYKTDFYVKENFHFNRAIIDITNIKSIEMDNDFAYLIGNNIHYIYRHSIHNNFLNDVDEYFYEWIDRQADDISIINFVEFGKNIEQFYVIKDYDIDVYQMKKASPSLSCSAHSFESPRELNPLEDSSGNKSGKKNVSSLTGLYRYSLSFYSTDCEAKLEEEKIVKQFFYLVIFLQPFLAICQQQAELEIFVSEKDYLEEYINKSFKYGFKFGLVVTCIILSLCCCLIQLVRSLSSNSKKPELPQKGYKFEIEIAESQVDLQKQQTDRLQFEHPQPNYITKRNQNAQYVGANQNEQVDD